MFFSCKRIEPRRRHQKGTLALIVPVNFEWQSSRNIKFSISLTDQRFGNSVNRIAIYNGDPETGGKLLSKGSFTLIRPFYTRISLPNHLTSVYLVRTAPDNTSLTSKVQVNIADITLSMGL